MAMMEFEDHTPLGPEDRAGFVERLLVALTVLGATLGIIQITIAGWSHLIACWKLIRGLI